jgi:hypothetical protein
MLLLPARSGVMHSENADELLFVQLFPFKSSVKASRNLSIVSVTLMGKDHFLTNKR